MRKSGAATYFVAVNGDYNGAGTAANPWATINHAAGQARGRYNNRARRPLSSFSASATATFGAAQCLDCFHRYPGEEPILDGKMIERSSVVRNGLDNGVFQIEDVSYIRVIRLAIANSHDAGFTVRDTSHVMLINNSTTSTFSSGIAVCDTFQDKANPHMKQ